MCPKSALPEHIDEEKEWSGTDWDNPWQRWLLKFKHWFAFGPRSTEWWARWREYPIVFCAFSGVGYLRWETTDGRKESIGDSQNVLWITSAHNPDGDRTYLSAINYWCRWHVQLQWPLFFAFHFYFKKEDVPKPPIHPGSTVDGKLIYFRIGARRDADKIYWFPSLFLGGNWN